MLSLFKKLAYTIVGLFTLCLELLAISLIFISESFKIFINHPESRFNNFSDFREAIKEAVLCVVEDNV